MGITKKIIANIELRIENKTEFELHEKLPIANNFISDTHLPGASHNIHMEIFSGANQEFETVKPMFAAEDAWSVYRDEEFSWISLHPPAFSTPLWVARMDHRFSVGTVYCSQHLTDNPINPSVLFNPVSYPLDQILLMNVLPRIGGMIIHSAGWCVNDSGWIFAGKSGAGKSTISNLIVAETGTTFLSDDRIAVRKIGSEFLMYGTPWPGDAGYAVNESVPLKGIFFLSKGAENNIRKLNSSEAIARLMPVMSIPWYDREKVVLIMDFCDVMISRIPMVELTFVPGKAAVDMLVAFVGE